MEKLRLAICDDDSVVLSVVSGAIASAFKKKGIQVEVLTFRRAKDLEDRMKELEFQLLFLDIDMPEMDGITFAKKVRASNSRTDIIFVSSREDKVFDALRTNPGGFIRKSRFLEDAPEVIETWLKNRPKEETPKLVVQGARETVSYSLDSILYIEGEGKIQNLHIASQKDLVQVRRSMQELEEVLDPQGFLRIHKGYLVNYRYIRRLEDTEAVLTNGERIPLSRRRVQEIRNRYLELMRGGGTVILS